MKIWEDRHPVTIIGAIVTTISAIAFIAFFVVDIFRAHANPYLGIFFFLILPAFFILGLILIPIGHYFAYRRRLAGKPVGEWPRLDLNNPRQRGIVFAIFVLTLVNALIVSLAAYRGIEFMDSVAFCGTVCHEVMQPEYTAYQAGNHARVPCVGCHIGSGAPWFVRSKLSGTRQVFAVTFNTFSRPIPSPVTNLRPARDTCEQCHWPEKFTGDVIRVRKEYASDEKNTESTTTLRVHVGGGSNENPELATGIHWHMVVSNKIEYIATDDKRQVIPYVKITDRFGKVREYRAEGVTQEQLAGKELRTLDCVDCHNRPAHTFAASAERAVDASIQRGEIAQDLPFIRREGVAVLKASYPNQTAGMDEIAARIREFYRASYGPLYAAKRQEIERAIGSLQAQYRRNVFPSMNVSFGTYFNNIGHMDFPGCFRCHDDAHKAPDGTVIKQDCDTCHTIEQ